jgi:hypothetical protein
MKNRIFSFFVLVTTTITLATAIALISPFWTRGEKDAGALVGLVLYLIAVLGAYFFLGFSVGTIPVVLSVWAIFFSLKISKQNFAGKLAAAITNPTILAGAGLVLMAVVPPLSPGDTWLYARGSAVFLLLVVLIHQVILKLAQPLFAKVRLSKTVRKLKAHA